jgi:hypothetical protein
MAAILGKSEIAKESEETSAQQSVMPCRDESV